MSWKEYANKRTVFGKLLIKWWKKYKREFPWRHRKDPYAVLIAEMLLRKTTAQQVDKIYNAFINKYPTPEALCMADENELKEIIRPLGMENRRAELFVNLGKALIEEFSGNIPCNEKELQKLPGVGLYAANAVLSFSYNQNVPMVDTNFIRIIERIFDLKSSKARARNDRKIWDFARMLIPNKKSRQFNLAVLDFAAIICRSRSPKCDICPLILICVFHNKIEKEA